MKIKTTLTSLLTTILLVAVSCTKTEPQQTVTVDRQLVKFSYSDTSEQQIAVTSNGDWTVQADSKYNWIKVTPAAGKAPEGIFTISVEPNSGESRHGTIFVVNGNAKAAVVVSQAGYEESIAIDGGSELTLSGSGESKEVKILSNTDWTASTEAIWLNVTPNNGSKDASVTIAAGMTTEERSAEVVFTTVSGNKAVLNVKQEAIALDPRDCAVMIDGKFIDIAKKSKGIYEGVVDIPATTAFLIQMGTKLYGFAESCGAGGLGTATVENAGKSGLPLALLPAASTTALKTNKAKGVMAENGNPFWINYESAGKMRVVVDAVSASDPRYMLYKVNEDLSVIYDEQFDLVLGEGSYVLAMNTYQTPADEFAVQSIYGPWNAATAKFTAGAFNGYFYDGGVTTEGKCVPKTLLEEMEIADWTGSTSSYFQYQYQCLQIGGSSKPALVYTPFFPLKSESPVEVTLDLFRFAPGTTCDINITVEGNGNITSGGTTVDYIEFHGAPAAKDWNLTGPVKTVTLIDDQYFPHTIDWSGCGTVNNGVDKPVSHMKFSIVGADSDTRLNINSGSASARLQIHGMKIQMIK